MFAVRSSTSKVYKLMAATLLSALGIYAGLQASPAIAAETSAPEGINTFKESNAVNGILCIAACNEFFEAGQASFELEIRSLQIRSLQIRSLQSRAVRAAESGSLLQVEPNLVEALEEQRETESRQNF